MSKDELPGDIIDGCCDEEPREELNYELREAASCFHHLVGGRGGLGGFLALRGGLEDGLAGGSTWRVTGKYV